MESTKGESKRLLRQANRLFTS